MKYILIHIFGSIFSILSLLIPKKKNLVLLGSTLGKTFSDSGSVLYLHILKNYNNWYGRNYHPELFKERILDNSHGFSVDLYEISNVGQIDPYNIIRYFGIWTKL